MIKNTLEQYCYLKKEIEYLEEKIDRLEQKSSKVADTVQNGVIGKKKKIAVVFGTDVNRRDKLAMYQLKLKLFYDELFEVQNEIEDFVETIENPEIRLIFRYRIFENYGWIKIMHLMEYNEESTARKKYERFLEKVS